MEVCIQYRILGCSVVCNIINWLLVIEMMIRRDEIDVVRSMFNVIRQKWRGKNKYVRRTFNVWR